jgi:hypothetical protein
MVSWRAYRTKGTASCALQYPIDRAYAAASGAQGGSQSVLIHGGVTIQGDHPCFGSEGENEVYHLRCVRKKKVVARGQRGLKMDEPGIKAAGDQLILDGFDAPRPLGVMRSVTVQQAVWMGNES